MSCSDVLILQRLLDGDLDEAQAELVAHHLESCSACRNDAVQLAELNSFVQSHLGAEDEGEEDADTATLARISQRLPRQSHQSSVRFAWKWNRTWMTAASVGALVLLLPLVFVPTLRAWPSRILEEATAYQRMWQYQPNKTLQWEVHTDSRGIKEIFDGRWRTHFWQKNGATTFTQISRQFDPTGRVAQATWQQPDGSNIRYRSRDGAFVEISPATEEVQAALPTLAPELRAALESYLSTRELARSLEAGRRRGVDRLLVPAVASPNTNVTFRESFLDQWGKVYRIRVVDEPTMNPSILRAVHDYDIERLSLRTVRLKSTLTYADGTVGIHDARWSGFREIPPEEFDAQLPAKFLESGIAVVRLTPTQLARRYLQDTRTAEAKKK
jgi:hypothetical protein